MKIVAQNKKAYHDYEIIEKLEAGIVLNGDEVKSLRAGTVSLTGSFAVMHDGELYLINCNITPYKSAYTRQDDTTATRRRKLLVRRKQLMRLIGDISKKGITIIPLSVYFNERNLAKVELGIGKHKKAASKKQELKERDIQRQTRRELRGRYDY
jgi:SsrA-binding protein